MLGAAIVMVRCTRCPSAHLSVALSVYYTWISPWTNRVRAIDLYGYCWMWIGNGSWFTICHQIRKRKYSFATLAVFWNFRYLVPGPQAVISLSWVEYKTEKTDGHCWWQYPYGNKPLFLLFMLAASVSRLSPVITSTVSLHVCLRSVELLQGRYSCISLQRRHSIYLMVFIVIECRLSHSIWLSSPDECRSFCRYDRLKNRPQNTEIFNAGIYCI